MRVRRCPRCDGPFRRDGRHLDGDDSPFCDLNSLLRRIRELVVVGRSPPI